MFLTWYKLFGGGYRGCYTHNNSLTTLVVTY